MPGVPGSSRNKLGQKKVQGEPAYAREGRGRLQKPRQWKQKENCLGPSWGDPAGVIAFFLFPQGPFPRAPGLLEHIPCRCLIHSVQSHQEPWKHQRRIYRERERLLTGGKRPDFSFVLCLPGRNHRSSNESQGRRSDDNYRGESPRAGRVCAPHSRHTCWRGRSLAQRQAGVAHLPKRTVPLALLGTSGGGGGRRSSRGPSSGP